MFLDLEDKNYLVLRLAQQKEGPLCNGKVSNDHSYIVSISKIGFMGYFGSHILISLV